MFHALLKLAVYNAYSLEQFSKGKEIKTRRGKASYLRDYSHYVSARARDGIEDVLAVLSVTIWLHPLRKMKYCCTFSKAFMLISITNLKMLYVLG